MQNHKVSDTITIDGTRIRDDGYMVVDARVARTGIQQYLGSEVGRPDLKTVDVYRPPEEVFSVDAMKSFAHRPVTNDHPSVDVTSENWKQFAVGQTDGEIRQDGQFLRIPLMVSDAKAIADVQNGKRELSNGYDCVFDFTPGVAPEGSYDAVQRNIRGNHIAIVGAGRAGSECRIGDDAALKWGASPLTTVDLKGKFPMENLQQKMVDGIPVQCTDAAALTIDKLLNDRASVQSLLDKATADAAVLAETHAKELATKDASIDDLKSKLLDSTAVDALVASRSKLIDAAKKIIPDVKTDGVSDSDIRKSVVVTKCGDSVLAGREGPTLDAYVDARFDTLVEGVADTKPTDQFGRAISDNKGIVDNGDAFAKRQAAFDGLIAFDQNGQEVKAN